MVVGISGEEIRLLARDSCVALDKDGHLPIAVSIPTERGLTASRRSCLLRCVVAKDGGLDSDTKGDGLVGVDGLVRLLAIEVTGELLDTRNAGRAANEDNFVHV